MWGIMVRSYTGPFDPALDYAAQHLDVGRMLELEKQLPNLLSDEELKAYNEKKAGYIDALKREAASRQATNNGTQLGVPATPYQGTFWENTFRPGGYMEQVLPAFAGAGGAAPRGLEPMVPPTVNPGPRLSTPKPPRGGAGPGPTAKGAPARPSWRESEVDAGKGLNKDYKPQKSFKDGEEVPYGTKGSSRPEYFKPGASLEVKNYDVTTAQGRRNVANNVSEQAIERSKNLPAGTRQTVLIDVRGQKVSKKTLDQLAEDIVVKSGGTLTRGDIKFRTR